MADASLHKDHRKRLKERFRKDGLDGFTPVQVLELLLFYVIPRRDTNDLAHHLINRFGSLSMVLEAPMEELMKVEGIGPEAAQFLHMIPAVSRSYLVDKTMQNKVLKTIDQCGQFLLPYFVGRQVETVFLLCLDAKCKVLSCREVGEGSVNSAGISIRKIVEMALASNTTAVVLSHNHPSGVAVPSFEDVQTTHRIADALRAVEIHLVDHIVVADDDYVSMVQSGHRFDGSQSY